MGWGITYEAYLSKITLDELETKLEDEEESLLKLKERLLVLSAMTPQQVEDESGYKEPWIDYVTREFNILWDDIIETISIITKLRECIDSDTKKNI